MKKKITVIALAAIVAIMAVAGATLAYFTDEDSADNTFTMKGIDITLEEEFTQNSELIPGIEVNKDVYVKNNEDSADAYVRVHIAVPTCLDGGIASEDATGFLHLAFTDASIADGQWSWLNASSAGAGYSDGASLNSYAAEIDGVDCTVYVVTYRTALKAGETTKTQALDKVFLDSSVDADLEDGAWVYSDGNGNKVTAEDFGGSPEIKVFAEAAQSATFSDAYTALNTAFGAPGSTGYIAPWNR